ncbi:hypothetical protein CLF_104430 [Clonorchis sinensis]|nr:hypothetical protein CLF_104430 [Clonorchis sinensis]
MTDNPWPGLGKALAAASTRPARGLRLYQQGDPATGPPKLRKGSLEPGADADFVILCPTALSHPVSPKVKVISTWIRGVPAFQSPECKFTVSNSRQSV